MIGREAGMDLSGEPDLAPSYERWLGAWDRKEHGSELLFETKSSDC